MKLMAPLGVLTKKSTEREQWKDILFGRKMAQGVGALDIGQTVVVKNAAVISVEASKERTRRFAARVNWAFQTDV